MSGNSFYRSIDLINAVTKKLKIHELVTKGDRILVSISGGQDSLCLVFLLNQLSDQMELHLVFFWCNHLWQLDSFLLMKEIAKLSFLFQFPSCFAIPSAFIPSELAARNWRQHSSFRISVFYNYDKIGLAHSANDKIETLFLNLIRGTGLTGLSPLRWIQDSSGKITQEHRASFPFFFVSKFYWSFLFAAGPVLKKDIPDRRKERLMVVLLERFNKLGANPPLKSLTRWKINRKKNAPFLFTFSLVNSFSNLPKRTFTTSNASNSFTCFPSPIVCCFSISNRIPSLYRHKDTPLSPKLRYPPVPPLPSKVVQVDSEAQVLARGMPSWVAESTNFLSPFVPLVANHLSLEYANIEQFFGCIPFLWTLQARKKRSTPSNIERLKYVAMQDWASVVRFSYIQKNFFSFNYRANRFALRNIKNLYRGKYGGNSSNSTSLVSPLLFLKRISLHKHIQSFSEHNRNKMGNKMALKSKKGHKAKKWFYSISSTLLKIC